MIPETGLASLMTSLCINSNDRLNKATYIYKGFFQRLLYRVENRFYLFWLPYSEDRHAGNNWVGVVLSSRIDGIVGSNYQNLKKSKYMQICRIFAEWRFVCYKICVIKVVIYFFHFQYNIVWHSSLSEKNIQLSRHATLKVNLSVEGWPKKIEWMNFLPATGWMPNLTFFPFFFKIWTISDTGYWPLATARP